MDDTENPNVFKFNSVKGGREEEPEDKVPHNDYIIVDVDEYQFDVNGFLIFTPHHLAIMQDNGNGAIPALVLPISRVKIAGLAAVVLAD